jgi:sugar phosphate isomerase/epimerase
VDLAVNIAPLSQAGYDYVVSIEHEDWDFEKSEELVRRGFCSNE